MSITRLFDYNPLNGRTQLFHEHPDGSFEITTHADVTDNIEHGKEMQNAAEGGWKGDMHRVASIPFVVLEELMKKGIIDQGFKVLQPERFREFLNDRDHRHFRTKLGQV